MRRVAVLSAALLALSAGVFPAHADEVPPPVEVVVEAPVETPAPVFDAGVAMTCDPMATSDCLGLPTPTPAPRPIGGPRDFALRVPDDGCGRAACGGLTLTVPTAPTAGFELVGRRTELGIAYLEFAAPIAPVLVTDTRLGALPWELMGQMSYLQGSNGGGLAALYTGWIPQVVDRGAGALAGPVVPPGYVLGTPGLSVPRVLALARAGHNGDGDKVVGTVGGRVLVHLPLSHTPGEYRGTLTLTLMS